jgi:hypothetical protein
MKKFNSLFYLGLTLLLFPILIFIVVAYASSRPAKIQKTETQEVVVVDVNPKEIAVDTIKESKPTKLVKKKKPEVSDSIKFVIRKDTLIQKDTLISK